MTKKNLRTAIYHWATVFGIGLSALAIPTPSAAASPMAEQLSEISDYVLPMGHGNAGKWYAEVSVESLKGARVGIDNIGNFIAIGDSRPSNEEKPDVLGLALDLDARMFYWRDSRSGAIGKDGVPLAPSEKPYGIRVSADKNLETLLKYGSLRINYGQAPFKFAMPAGYSPWYYTRDTSDVANWLVPPYERVDEKDIRGHAEGFWRWLQGRDPKRHPALDRSGQFCAEGQSGALWFLAGGAAADRIERTCAIPFGSSIVVPVITALFPSNDLATCKATAEVTKLAPYSMQNSFLEINGKRFDRLQGYSASQSNCAEAVVDGKPVAANSVWMGMWVPLRPLPRGEHTISFGGRVNAINVDRQVTYKIVVR